MFENMKMKHKDNDIITISLKEMKEIEDLINSQIKKIAWLERNVKYYYEAAGFEQKLHRELSEEIILIREYLKKLTYSLDPICRDMNKKSLKMVIKNEKKRF